MVKRANALVGILAGDLPAGIIVSAGNIALAVGFAAVIFHGELSVGVSIGLWSFLMSMVVSGVVVGLTTSMPPIGAGPDTPVVAVMTLLSAGVAAQITTFGGSTGQIITHTMLAFTLMTLMSGATMYFIGALQLGQWFRFVPYPVVAGFLAATGWLMILSSYKVITGEPLTTASFAQVLQPGTAPKVAIAILFAVAVLVLGERIRGSYLLPVAFFGTAAVIDLILWRFAATNTGWFIPDVENLSPWFPVAAALSHDIHWDVLLKASPEMLTCVIVGIISVVVKVSGVETSRKVAADLNQEFRANGAASLLAAPLGAVAGSLLVSSSKAYIETGARTKFSAIAAGITTGLVVLAGINLPGRVPTPVLAGLLILLGYNMLTSALRDAFKQKLWAEFALASAVALVCVRFGYIVGVLLGFVCACLVFAFNYGRIGVIRRHLTRRSFASDVERAPAVEHILRAEGDAIQLYWLSGYMFFGSSEGLFERVRATIESQTIKPVRFVLLDVAGVSGMDSSAVAGLVKLMHLCDKRSITLVYSGLSNQIHLALISGSLVGEGKPHRAFPSRNEALDWSEEQLLNQLRPDALQETSMDFQQWVADELGAAVACEVISAYFSRRELAGGEILYRRGDPSDTIDFVASGTLAVSADDGRDPPRRIHRSTRQTVVGEMGFFRRTSRAAMISAEGPAVIYSLTRESLERMQLQDPQVYAAFLGFVIRTLSDRLELANQEVSALT